MTGNEKGGSQEIRLKQLLFRAQRRGFKEVDLIFGTYAETRLASLSDGELDQFDALLNAPDHDVYAWLRGHTQAPSAYDTPIFAELKSLCARKDPKWNG